MSTLNDLTREDEDRRRTLRSAGTIMNILHDFIPQACRREAMDRLLETFEKVGLELAGKEMRLELESLKKSLSGEG